MEKKPFAVEYYNIAHCDVIGYVDEGTGIIESGSERRDLVAGDSYLLRAGEHYQFYTKSNGRFRSASIGFAGNIVTNVLDAYGFTRTAIFSGVNVSEYLRQIQDIALPTSSYDDLILDQCCTMFVEMCQYIRKQWQLPKKETQELQNVEFRDVELLKNYMDTHLHESFTLERCSEMVSLSISQTSRRFQRLYGVPICKYLNNKRIETAQKLLRDTNYSIQNISEQVGFKDTYYFSRYFKKVCGKSPREYREMF